MNSTKLFAKQTAMLSSVVIFFLYSEHTYTNSVVSSLKYRKSIISDRYSKQEPMQKDVVFSVVEWGKRKSE